MYNIVYCKHNSKYYAFVDGFETMLYVSSNAINWSLAYTFSDYLTSV
jgi:hypothetical protein